MMTLSTIAEENPSRKGPGKMKLSEKVSKAFVEARCTDNILFSVAVSIGSIVLLLQTCPVLMNNWVHLTEPRPINKTNENGEQLEAVFDYNAGYFEVCREFLKKENDSINLEDIAKNEADYRCHLNPLFSRQDLSDFSVASLAVILRLGLPALFHMCGAFICSLAFMLGVAGHVRKTFYTLLSSISYICGSIVLSTAVLMFVCVVDDELAPRMKPNAAGEPSKFSFKYGAPFYSSSLSFVPVQICACLHAFLYFRRYPTVVEKLKFVPG
ncbi:stg-2, partial [Pristionchus pacificus]